jgi:hypothetical protein
MSLLGFEPRSSQLRIPCKLHEWDVGFIKQDKTTSNFYVAFELPTLFGNGPLIRSS